MNCIRVTVAFCLFMLTDQTFAQQKLMLIAHRGGVVDSTYTENGLPALKKAAAEGYAMIETDVRVTKDGILFANHDADFKRYYHVDKKVTDLNWSEISQLKSALDGNVPMKLEDVFQFCQKNKMSVMLDNKIAGLDTVLFNQLLKMLDKYQLRKTALMIGTDESTAFFTGKIKLSCTRQQLEENMKRPDYQPEHYFFFERPAKLTKDDVDWADKNRILLVAAINKFHYRKSVDLMNDAGEDCKRMLEIGVTGFQVDSEFSPFLH
ncbi:glycerophosphodiester phosphodiesterase [Dyadobacter luticola]|nr:glycerophosphodiester phosphodiesterase family protein [Dyadobacter luticola]